MRKIEMPIIQQGTSEVDISTPKNITGKEE